LLDQQVGEQRVPSAVVARELSRAVEMRGTGHSADEEVVVLAFDQT
jgi:hypothetical protein